MAIAIPVQKRLWGLSGGACAICSIAVAEIERKSVLGEMAHIKGEKPDAERYDSSMSDEERNSYENLIVLCPTCHTKIDKTEKDAYPIERLHKIKREHEITVKETLRAGIAHTTFVELAVLLKFIKNSALVQSSLDLRLLSPEDKIRKNSLGADVQSMIQLGMLRDPQVEEYINKNPDVNFYQRLKIGFVDKYQELRRQGLDGDALFLALYRFATGYSSEPLYQAAGLTILTYLFRICDIFEI